MLQKDSARLGQVAPLYEALRKSLGDMCLEQVVVLDFNAKFPYTHESDAPMENSGAVFPYYFMFGFQGAVGRNLKKAWPPFIDPDPTTTKMRKNIRNVT